MTISSRTTESLTIGWQAVSGGVFDHYRIRIDDDAAVEIAKSVTSLEWTFSNLGAGSSHTIRLWAQAGTASSSIQRLENEHTRKLFINDFTLDWKNKSPRVNTINACTYLPLSK